ncbi:MAG: transcriptional repressor [Geminicoccaceae bacterium]
MAATGFREHGQERGTRAGGAGKGVLRRLDQAAEPAPKRGQSLTPLRRQVLGIVLAADRPLGAYDVLEILARDRGRVAPPTVYRSLDFLVEQGLVHKVPSVNGFVACSSVARPHRRSSSSSAAPAVAAPRCRTGRRQARSRPRSMSWALAVESVVLEVRGLCRDRQGSAAA